MSESVEVEIVDGELLPTCKQAGCTNFARARQVLCDVHGTAASIAAARAKLAAAAPEAAEVLINLSLHGSTEAMKAKASAEVLDRAGVRGGVEVDVTAVVGPDPASVLRERLATLKRRTPVEIEPGPDGQA